MGRLHFSPFHLNGNMAKLADALDLGSSEATRAGSSPVIPTKNAVL